MAQKDIGAHGLNLIKSFEGFVPFVYDDFGPDNREWNGGPHRGTLTIGYGHTDEARDPLKIEPGLRITEAQGLEILHNDLGECVEQVNAMVKVPVTQGQFDALVSFTFNCGSGNTRRLVQPLNDGNYDLTRVDFGHYIRSKGEVMSGLERRRHAEQVLWDDNYGAIVHPTEPVPHPAVVDARTTGKTPLSTHAAAAVVAAGGAAEGLDKINATLSTVSTTQGSLVSILTAIAHNPRLWVAIAIIAGAAFLWWQHREKASA
jgi:lysozyme